MHIKLLVHDPFVNGRFVRYFGLLKMNGHKLEKREMTWHIIHQKSHISISWLKVNFDDVWFINIFLLTHVTFMKKIWAANKHLLHQHDPIIQKIWFSINNRTQCFKMYRNCDLLMLSWHSVTFTNFTPNVTYFLLSMRLLNKDFCALWTMQL